MSRCELLTPDNCTVIFIDHQPQMGFSVESMDRQLLVNNTVALAKSARAFDVPVILTAIESLRFSGCVWSQLLAVFPGAVPIERTSMNAWEDQAFVAAVERAGRNKLVMSGLWTEVCLVFPALSALAQGYEVYAVVDASAGTTMVTHEAALQRMMQAGAVPVTWMQVLMELQRDWARLDTYDATLEIVKQHGGAYGMGVEYAQTMLYSRPTGKPPA